MLSESVQLLTNAHHIFGDSFSRFKQYVEYRDTPFRQTHVNHPSSLWVRSSRQHYEWLVSHANALVSEFKFRRNKNHLVAQHVQYITQNPISKRIPDNGFVPPPLCMPDKYKSDDAVDSYRTYYINDKWKDKNGRRLDKWTNRGAPEWWVEPNVL
jgi:hypothetical protein